MCFESDSSFPIPFPSLERRMNVVEVESELSHRKSPDHSRRTKESSTTSALSPNERTLQLKSSKLTSSQSLRLPVRNRKQEHVLLHEGRCRSRQVPTEDPRVLVILGRSSVLDHSGLSDSPEFGAVRGTGEALRNRSREKRRGRGGGGRGERER